MRGSDRAQARWSARAAVLLGLAAVAACAGPAGDVGTEPPAAITPLPLASDTELDHGVPDPEAVSPGTVTVVLDGASIPVVEGALSCSWSDDGRVEAFIALEPVEIAAEAVYVELMPSARDAADRFSLFRDEAAAYRATPSSGMVEVVERTDDDAAGSIRFTDLGPDPDSVPPDVADTDRAAWLGPLGDDPGLAALSGIATWACAAAP